MSEIQQSRLETSIELPAEFDTAGAKLLYLYLAIEDEATIDELEAALGMRKISLYPLLRTLVQGGLVDRTGVTYACREPPSNGGRDD